MAYFETEQWVGVELPKVFGFFSDPANLPRIMPAELDASVISMELVEAREAGPSRVGAGPGSVITFTFKPVPFLPFRMEWVAEIVGFEYLAYFQDVQRRGPMKSWSHRHEFESQTRNGIAGTLVRDKVRFEVGFAVLGEAIEKLFLTRKMKHTFEHRQVALEHALKRA